ncbi:MAG: hrpB, partial [Nevskia sp.]|nr:hrpB [Nevskia sp.]
MLPPLPILPVADALPALRAALARDGSAVLAAPPGSGKTTLAPLLLLNEPWLQERRILMLEPRRIAARAAAARMAHLLGERVGDTIGYQIRFERKVSAATRIEVITEGLLTRRLQADADLPGVGLVIFDEFHERSLDADLALALTLDARSNLRPDLRVLVMSATLDTQRVAALLGGAEVIESGGRMFPVEIAYAPPRAGVELGEAVASAVVNALAARDGDALVFLPGAREIRDAQHALERRLVGRGEVELHLLYGDLASAQQDAALAPATAGRRKIILATNIAQTSLTIEGVSSVIDSGLARVARFDLGAGANRLETVRISRAAAEQRAGRAGRLGPGACVRLWSRDQHAQLPAHDTPEILAADLSRFALELAGWGVRDPSQAALLDAPLASAWRYAQELLQQLGAVDGTGHLSAHGRELARLPAPPRVAHMLLLAQRAGLGALAAWVAAVLEERSAGTDLALEVERFRSGRGVDAAALTRTRQTVRQLTRLIDVDDDASLPVAAVGRVVGLAYPE